MMNWLRAFMAGRNGLDTLGLASVIAAVVVNVLAQILDSYILSVVAMALMVYAFFRILSRNVTRRRQESYRFEHLFSAVRGGVSGWLDRRRQSKDYKFFTCPGCRNKLRVPRGKGKIQITCPKCGQRFGGQS